MKRYCNLIWPAVVILPFLLISACRIFPSSKPDNSGVKTPEIVAPKPIIPALNSLEFLAKSTYTGPSGVLYSTQNNAPCRGVLVAFYPNGRKKSEINYIDGLREGSAHWYAITGQLKHIRNYHKGQLNGIWTEYFEGSLQKRQEHTYDNGAEVMRRGWWANGQKKFEATFLNGEEKSRQSWDALGVLIHKNPISPSATPVNPQKQP